MYTTPSGSFTKGVTLMYNNVWGSVWLRRPTKKRWTGKETEKEMGFINPEDDASVVGLFLIVITVATLFLLVITL